jgi:hypothetical protein
MVRTGAAANLADGHEPDGQTPPSNIDLPIPIGMMPSRDASGRGSSHKRSYPEEGDMGDLNSDEEAAWLAEAEQAGETMSTTNDSASVAKTGREPELSEGVMAALAKLRED